MEWMKWMLKWIRDQKPIPKEEFKGKDHRFFDISPSKESLYQIDQVHFQESTTQKVNFS